MTRIIPGPCSICGGVNYELSLGGSTLCPSCDCGHFGIDRIRKQGEALVRYRKEVEDRNILIKTLIKERNALQDELEVIKREIKID